MTPIESAKLMSGVWSQKGDTSLGDKISLVDATDGIARGDQIPQSASGDGILLLADGSRFTGSLFGAEGWGQGELVFTTGMTGYQESLTDPSFAGQVLTFTYPLIGNYGIHQGTSESAAVWPRGVVVRQAMKNPDHRDSIASINEFLAYHKVPGIENIDTRAITKKVREYGCLLCVFGPVEEESQMAAHLKEMQSPELEDLVDQVSINEPVIINQGSTDKLGRALPRIAAIDCGIKYNILRSLCNYFEVVWCPPSTTFEQAKSYDIIALFCSNGPGDPAHPGKAASAMNTLAAAVKADIPVMGICLGHQLLGLASGLQTYKMRYGHRGANQPCVDLESGRVWITSQNHGFAVADPEAGMLAAHPSGACSPKGANLHGATPKVRFVNANDRTVEGLDLENKSVFTVQFHPEAAPGPHDAYPLFSRFREMVDSHYGGGK